MAKDLFSAHSDDYARYRPQYPPELFDYVLSFVKGRERAWDCATGNGQAAVVLANYFTTVEATDISEAQLTQAVTKPNIHYQRSPAEQTPFATASFDLITVAQAYHWLNWRAFAEEAARVGKRECVVAAWGYNLVRCEDKAIDRVVDEFYFQTIYRYWDAERRHVENEYRSVDFDFSPLPSKSFSHPVRWRRNDLLGYISTWSAVTHYTKQHGNSPLTLLHDDLEAVWPDESEKAFSFPLFLRIGKIER